MKAVFPVVAANDVYRDIAFFGGAPDMEFLSAYAGFTGGLAAADPPVEAAQSSTPPTDLAALEADHQSGWATYWAGLAASAESGGPISYDESYWRARNPTEILGSIVRNGVPAFLVGGWHDVFQRGELLNYTALQNAYFGRPLTAPMAPNQPVTGRYQLLMGPWYHLTAPAGVDVQLLELRWFDQWLKGEHTGIGETQTPLHLGPLGSDTYREAPTYPFPTAAPTTFYLSAGPTASNAVSTNDGALLTTVPTATSTADSVVFSAATSPCDLQTEQWSTGIPALGLQSAGTTDPCAGDDRAMQAGLGALTYTTPPFDVGAVVAGRIDVTLYITSNRPETFIETTVEDVAPSGQSTPLTSGGLMGSMRAVDVGRSWSVGGHLLLPYHPYTQASQAAVPTGTVTRLDIEVYPTFAVLAQGDRLRLTLTTSDTPHLVFTPSQLAGLTGGVYGVERSAAAASLVTIPLMSAAPAPTGSVPAPHAVTPGTDISAAATPNTARGAGASLGSVPTLAAFAVVTVMLRRRRAREGA